MVKVYVFGGEDFEPLPLKQGSNPGSSPTYLKRPDEPDDLARRVGKKLPKTGNEPDVYLASGYRQNRRKIGVMLWRRGIPKQPRQSLDYLRRTGHERESGL